MRWGDSGKVQYNVCASYVTTVRLTDNVGLPMKMTEISTLLSNCKATMKSTKVLLLAKWHYK